MQLITSRVGPWANACALDEHMCAAQVQFASVVPCGAYGEVFCLHTLSRAPRSPVSVREIRKKSTDWHRNLQSDFAIQEVCAHSSQSCHPCQSCRSCQCGQSRHCVSVFSLQSLLVWHCSISINCCVVHGQSNHSLKLNRISCFQLVQTFQEPSTTVTEGASLTHDRA